MFAKKCFILFIGPIFSLSTISSSAALRLHENEQWTFVSTIQIELAQEGKCVIFTLENTFR